jgi:hypothetical protein
MTSGEVTQHLGSHVNDLPLLILLTSLVVDDPAQVVDESPDVRDDVNEAAWFVRRGDKARPGAEGTRQQDEEEVVRKSEG